MTQGGRLDKSRKKSTSTARQDGIPSGSSSSARYPAGHRDIGSMASMGNGCVGGAIRRNSAALPFGDRRNSDAQLLGLHPIGSTTLPQVLPLLHLRTTIGMVGHGAIPSVECSERPCRIDCAQASSLTMA